MRSRLTALAVFAPLLFQLTFPVHRDCGWIIIENPGHARAMLVERDDVDGKNDIVFTLSDSVEQFASDDKDQSVENDSITALLVPRVLALPRSPDDVGIGTTAPPLHPPNPWRGV